MIACKTIIGYGAPTKAGTAGAHGSPLGKDEIAGARKNLGWPYPPFDIPEPIFTAWRKAGAGTAAARAGRSGCAAMAEPIAPSSIAAMSGDCRRRSTR